MTDRLSTCPECGTSYPDYHGIAEGGYLCQWCGYWSNDPEPYEPAGCVGHEGPKQTRQRFATAEARGRQERYVEAILRPNPGIGLLPTEVLRMADAVIAVSDEEQAELREELAKYKRGAKTLGETIEKQCQMALDASGRHDLIGEDGDGDWGAVWDHVLELRPRAEAAEAELDEAGRQLGLVWAAYETSKGTIAGRMGLADELHAILHGDDAQ